MNFYPYLFEDDQEESGVTLVQMEKILGKYLGKDVVLDPNTEEITHVGNKKDSTPIKDWDAIHEFSHAKRGFFIEFLNYIFDKRGINIDVKDVVTKMADNKKKAKQKTFVPHEIPSFPRIGLKYQDFWDYQLDVYSSEIEKEKEITLGKTKAKKTKVTVDDERETEINIPHSLVNFYKDAGKEKEWNSFISNIEKSGLSTISFINNLFRYMAAVAEDRVQPDDVYRPTAIKLKLNTPEEVQKWKSDMVSYIGRYSNDNINDINKDDTYTNILSKGTFLNILMVTEPKGVGRGEVLMSYIMDGARFAGGGEAFDVTCNGVTYELKDYSGEAGPIRLGTHGNVTRFDWWSDITDIVKFSRKIKQELGDDKLKAMIGNYFFRIWELVSTKKSFKEEKRAVGSAIEAGELNKERLERLKVFCMLSHELATRGKRDEEEGKYTYAILKGDDVKAQTINIEPVESEEIEKVEEIKVDYDEDDLKTLKELINLTYIKNPLKIQEDLNNIGKDYNEGVLNVDYFMIFQPNEVIIDKPKNFVYSTISQAGVRIKPKKEEIDIETIADKAFKKWKGQADDSFLEIWRDIRAGISESFYPKLKINQ